MKQYDVILFDMDGTLTDSSDGILNSVAYAMNKMGLPVPPREELFVFIGPPLSDTFTKCCGMNPEEAQKAIACYREYFSVTGLYENAVYEGVIPLLKKLQTAGKELVLATSKPEIFTGRILEHFGLDRFFTHVAGATMDDTRSKKSDVIAYALSLCRPADLSRVVMVGDRRHDIDGAKAHGLDSIGVLYGYGNRAELEAAGATFIAPTISDLEALLL